MEISEKELSALLIVKERFMKWAESTDGKETEQLRKQFEELTGLPAKCGYITNLVAFSAGFKSALDYINELEQNEGAGHEKGN